MSDENSIIIMGIDPNDNPVPWAVNDDGEIQVG